MMNIDAPNSIPATQTEVQKSPTATSKKKKPRQKRATIFWWKYLGGEVEMSIGYYTKKNKALPKDAQRFTFASISDCKVERKKQTAKLKKSGYAVTVKKLKPIGDVESYLEPQVRFQGREQTADQWREFQKMLTACGDNTVGNDEILKLVIWMLSGYYARDVLPEISIMVESYPYKAAPLIAISKTGQTRWLVEYLVRSVAVPQTVKRGCAPCILPDKLGANNILDCAYVRFGGRRKKNAIKSVTCNTQAVACCSIVPFSKIQI